VIDFDLAIGVLVLDSELRIAEVSSAFCRSFATTADALLGVHLDELIATRDRRGLREYSRTLASGKPIDMLLALDFGARDVLTRIRLMHVDGRHLALVERIDGEGNLLFELYRDRRRWQQIIKRSVEGVVILDAEDRILDHNDRFFEIMGFRSRSGVLVSEDALHGADFLGLLAGQSGFDELREHLGTAATRHTRYRSIIVHGDRWIEIATTSLILPVHGFIGSSIVLRDITEERQTELLLRQKESAEAANVAKSRFLANMSHELRTPLNAIIGYSEMILEEAEQSNDVEIADDLRKILNSGSYLLELINNILDLSKIEAGKMELWCEAFSIRSMLDDVLATATPLLAKNGNQIEVRCASGIGQMTSDLLKLRQVLLNLLSNAGKFTKDGSVTLSLRRIEHSPGDILEIEITDTGIGIPEAKLQRIFEEFAQADATTSRAYGGTGLGLALSRRFCRILGGELSVRSTLGVGSTFTVRLPTSPLEGTEDNEVPSSVTVAEAPAEVPTGVDEPAQKPRNARSSGDTVLVVDDDPAVLDMMIRFLTREQWSVVAVSSPAHVLAIARSLRPSAITLDVLMPEAEGWDILAALKADPELAEIPVIMMSIVDEQSRGLRLGATDYLLKPIDRGHLLRVLNRQRHELSEPSVLVIDDDASARALVRTHLVRSGWRVREACDGDDGLDHIKRERPDVVLLDLVMPRCDGFRFLDRLRASPDLRSIPVVVLTAKDLSSEERNLLLTEAQEILGKTATTPQAVLDGLRLQLGDLS